MLIQYISGNKKTSGQNTFSFLRDLKLEQHGIPLWSYLVCLTDFWKN